MTSLTSCSTLPIGNINREDTSYNLRPQTGTDLDQSFIEHIEKFGILHPPLVQKKKQQTVILSGRKRIEAACRLKLEELPCLILKQGCTDVELFETLLEHAQTGSKLSVIEQALFFSKVNAVLPAKQALSLLPLLGIKQNQYKLKEFESFLRLAPEAIDLLHCGLLQPKVIGKLGKLSKDDQQELAGLIDFFKLGGSKQQKLVTYALELVMRNRRPFASFAGNWQEEEAEYDNRPQHAAALLSKLDALCFPNTGSAEAAFQQLQKTVQLPKNTTLQHTVSFEDDRLTLSIFFDNQDDFIQGWERIKTRV